MKITDDDIINACDISDSMLSASKMLNIPWSTFVRRAKKIGCYLPNQGWSKGKNSAVNSSLFRKYTYDDYFSENSKVGRACVKARILNMNLIEYKCLICNIIEWNNKKLSLHLDHINGITNDNRLSNLRFLCPNCHSQTETYCSNRNKNRKVESYNTEEICNIISNSRSLNESFNTLGIIYNKINKTKILEIIKEFNLSYKTETSTKGRDVKKNLCKCNKVIGFYSKTCIDCSHLNKIIDRPSYEQLIIDIKNTNYTQTGIKYGVSDNCIRKWIKKYESKSNNY